MMAYRDVVPGGPAIPTQAGLAHIAVSGNLQGGSIAAGLKSMFDLTMRSSHRDSIMFSIRKC
jgi:hypothetical protein